MIEVTDDDDRLHDYPTGVTWERDDGYLEIYDEGRHLVGEHAIHEWKRVRLVNAPANPPERRTLPAQSNLPGFMRGAAT